MCVCVCVSVCDETSEQLLHSIALMERERDAYTLTVHAEHLHLCLMLDESHVTPSHTALGVDS